ncbi:hypothetical protein HYW32_02570 [Candidatus Berkelbacteria bacterium]|nr:hypothetical protein [Candidatus Berkelbacteria bacterium]
MVQKKVGSNFQIKDRTGLFEPRGAWKNLLDSGIIGGNTFVSRLRRDLIAASNSDFQFWRCFLIDVRTFFEQNPE